jgi:hypothetical protein
MRRALIAILLGLALPAAAVAAGRPIVPQGNSSADQYIESVPTARGQRPTASVQTTSTRVTSVNRSGSVPAATQRTLAHDGATGRLAASFAAATGPAIAHKGTTRRHAGRSRRPATATRSTRAQRRSSGAAAATRTPPGSSPGATSRGTAVADALTGVGGSTGAWLPIILIVLTVGAVALRLRRPSSAD